LKLFAANEHAKQIFHRRRSDLASPAEPIRFSGMILAPARYYEPRKGQRHGSIIAAARLLTTLRNENRAEIQLCIWDAPTAIISELVAPRA
jgi:hypothetical protein